MLILSVFLHITIVFGLAFQSRFLNRGRIKPPDKLSFMLAAPVPKSKLHAVKNKLPPPVVAPKPVVKTKKKAKIVEKKKKNKQQREKKQKKKKGREIDKNAISKLLSEMNTKLDKRREPAPNNYSKIDALDLGALQGKGSSGTLIDAERYRYQLNLRAILSENWHVINKAVIRQLKDPSVMVTIKINKDGYIINRKLEKSSSNSYYDRSVIRAIDKSEPFPPPPAKLVEEALTEGITIEFLPPLD